MHKLYELKDHLLKELEAYSSMDGMDTGSLEVIDKLSHSIKSICAIIEAAESEESSYEGEPYNSRMSRRSYRGYNSYGNSYRRGRDSMGRYTSRAASDIAGSLRELMQDAPDEQTRMELQRLVSKMENM